MIFGSKYKRIIKENEAFKNSETGKSCIILMGGVSVKNIDLDEVAKNDVITANNFFQTDDYLRVRPKYHVIVDRDFWTIDENEKDLFNKIGDFTTVFLNIRGTKPRSRRNIRYIYPLYRVTDSSFALDISKPCANFSTVTLACIQLAIYLGYKSIKLVGFDFPPGVLPHYYTELKDEIRGREAQSNVTDEFGYCSLFWQYTNAHHESYKISSRAKQIGVDISNLSPISYIRSFRFEENSLE